MRYLILILSIILFISCKSLNNQKQAKYRVYKIENLISYHIIYCEKDGQKYKIVSKDDKTTNKYKKIKTGEFYNFILKNYTPKNNDNNPLTNTNTTPYVIRCYMFDGTKVCEEEFIKLYTTDNLKGLYYIK